MSRTSNRVCEDKTGLFTSSMALVVTCLIHFTMGTLFNYPEDNTRFPTLGSTLFIFATSIYTLSRRLMPCSLYIRSGTLQSICKILIVIFISNVLLVGIWIQIENLTVELSYIVHDMLVFLNICATWIRYIPCVLSNIMGAVILLWVIMEIKRPWSFVLQFLFNFLLL